MRIRNTPAPEKDATYPQGFESLADRIQRQRTPFVDLDGKLPDPEMELVPLKFRLLPEVEAPAEKPLATLYEDNARWLAERMGGQSELAHLLACLIMLSRRDPFPEDMKRLFFRLWDEEAVFLAQTLPTRWKISALRTFGAHGRTELERRLGREFFLVTGMMKLADTERSFSGRGTMQGFRLGNRKNSPVSLGLEPYSITLGDLDEHIIAQLWETVDALGDTGAGILGRSVLDEINACPRTVFRRRLVIREKFRRARTRRAS